MEADGTFSEATQHRPAARVGHLAWWKDPRPDEWRQRLRGMAGYRTTDELMRRFGPPEHRVAQRNTEIWHYLLGAAGGSLHSIHAVLSNGELKEAYMHVMPCGAYVQHGTPEQMALIQHRYWVLRVVSVGFIGSVFAGFLIPHALGLHLSRTSARVFGIGYFLCGALALVIFSIAYWRCPVCKNEFSRQSGGKYCEYCNTKFSD